MQNKLLIKKEIDSNYKSLKKKFQFADTVNIVRLKLGRSSTFFSFLRCVKNFDFLMKNLNGVTAVN